MVDLIGIHALLSGAHAGYAFPLNAVCFEDVYELRYTGRGKWMAYSHIADIPVFSESLTVVTGSHWEPDLFAGLCQSGAVTVFAGELPKGVKIPEGAKVYAIGDPTKGLVEKNS